MAKALLIFLLALATAHGAEIRVATYNILTGIEAPGTTSHDAAKAVLGRINADVVGLQEVTSSDRSGNPSHLEALASSLGYPHIHIPNAIALDTNSRVILISKYPFLSTHSIGSPSGSKDVVRAHAAAVVDVPGTSADPMIITLHLKCCFDPDDSFRRAVEMQRIKFFLNDQGLDGSDNVIVMGDYNLLGGPQTYSSLPPGLPATYSLGPDISLPITYYSNPVTYFNSYPLENPNPLQQNGTNDATHSSGATLDYIIISEALNDRGPVLEVYNSELESSHPGLPKSGSPLPFNTSDQSSDHLPIFGDFDLDDGNPLSLALNSSTLSEAGPSGTLTVTLPTPPAAGETVTVLVASSDCEEAMPSPLTLTFGPGVTQQSTTIIPQPDSIIDGNQTLTLTASAVGFEGASIPLTITDQDTPTYPITAFDSPVTENFHGFIGTQNAARWTISTPTWQGLDDGASATLGPRSYGLATDGSLGILSPSSTTFSGTFANLTGSPINNLEINYDAEQWRSTLGGSANTWTVSVITPSGTTTVPALTFTADATLPTGPIANGTSSTFNTTVTNLNIPPTTAFQIVFQSDPGTLGGGGSDTAFINEFHYDNDGSDLNEFVEIVLGPDFPGTIDDLELVFYNGNNQSTYKTSTLSAADLGQTTATGHKIYSKNIGGIQNGASDGIALIHNGTVLEFLSYEGTLTATNGPASGLTSTDIGVSQPSNNPSGQNSLGRTGTGSGPDDFTWAESQSAFTNGAPNTGQTFGTSTNGQGIAIDNLQVTAVLTPPSLPPLTLSSDFTLTFPTQSGTNYRIDTSTDLQTWTVFTIVSGTGSPANINANTPAPKRFFRLSIHQ